MNKEYIFESNADIELYLSIINKNIEKFNLTIMAYCMMNNHAHFLIYVTSIEELGKFIKICNLQYAQIYNRKKNRIGVLFRNRYQTEPIYDIKYLINCIKYIHNNPVKANMVKKCEDYKYSSYNDYINNVGIAKSNIVKSIFGEKCDYQKMFNESFVLRQMDITEENKDTDYYINQGIIGYKKEYSVSLVEILSNRENLKKIIFYLKNNCKIEYKEIMNYFDIPIWFFNSLKIY